MEPDAEDQEEMGNEDANMNYRDSHHQGDDKADQAENNPQDLLAAAGLEDSDAEDDAVILSPSPPPLTLHTLPQHHT